jgi:anaerobic glycerol-3-phosphate dehydrogenase
MSKTGRWSEMAAEIPDDLLHEFVAAAPYDQLAGAIAKRFGGITDSITIDFPKDLPAQQSAELLADLKAIPSVFRGFDTAASTQAGGGAGVAEARQPWD